MILALLCLSFHWIIVSITRRINSNPNTIVIKMIAVNEDDTIIAEVMRNAVIGLKDLINS